MPKAITIQTGEWSIAATVMATNPASDSRMSIAVGQRPCVVINDAEFQRSENSFLARQWRSGSQAEFITSNVIVTGIGPVLQLSL
ncbi:hypothetical protein [Phenylobacterium sp.]|uniref:hypothetical protein n=1 Tax=Phenylobacterium sp. TaxID=1871053 RepID=UPI0035B0C19B